MTGTLIKPPLTQQNVCGRNTTDQPLWPFVPRAQPLSIQHTEGAYLYLKDGTKILDAAGGAIVVNIGHGRKEMADVIAKAAQTNSFVLPLWLTPEREALVNELQQHWLPPHLTRCHFTSGGSEANEAAVKMAVQYQVARGKPNKHIILTRSISYHGATRATGGWSGHPTRKKGLEKVLTKNPMIETPYPLRCPLGAFHPDATDYYIDNLQRTIDEVGADNIAALLAEPMSGASGGAIAPPPNYWPRVQAILKENDILLICDEVMTGFGRLGTPMGCDFFNITPDLLVGGKGLSSGYAGINGVFGTDTIADALREGGFEPMYFTHSAMPMACAAATKALEIQRREHLVERAKTVGAQLKQRLIDEFSDHPHVAEVRGEGMLLALEIVKDKSTLTPFDIDLRITDKIVEAGFRHGVFFYPGGTGEVRDIIVFGPPFIIGEPEIDLIINAFKACLADVLGAV